MPTDICIHISMDMCMNMHMGICTHISMDMCMGMCGHAWTYDMCMDM